MRLILLAFLVCGLLANKGRAQERQADSKEEPEVGNVKVLTDLEDAVVKANETKKPVFVYVFDSV